MIIKYFVCRNDHVIPFEECEDLKAFLKPVFNSFEEAFRNWQRPFYDVHFVDVTFWGIISKEEEDSPEYFSSEEGDFILNLSGSCGNEEDDWQVWETVTGRPENWYIPF